MSTDNDPAYLYKYRSLKGEAREHTERIVMDNVIWFSSPACFNDPFDCSPIFSMKASNVDTQRYLASLFQETVRGLSRNQRRTMLNRMINDPERGIRSPQFSSIMHERQMRSINSAGILSLSALPDQMLMWSHYGEAHTGICLRFSCAPWAFPICVAQKVIYSAARPIVRLIMDDADSHVNKAILTKADYWAYEEEWRVISFPGSGIGKNGPGLTTFKAKALDGLIVGARISDDDAAAVRQWVKTREFPVELLKARLNADQFRINIVPLDSPCKKSDIKISSVG